MPLGSKLAPPKGDSGERSRAIMVLLFYAVLDPSYNKSQFFNHIQWLSVNTFSLDGSKILSFSIQSTAQGFNPLPHIPIFDDPKEERFGKH